MGAALVAIQKPGAGQRIGAGAKGADLRTTLGLLAQPRQVSLLHRLLNIDAPNHNHQIELNVVGQCVVELNAHAITADLLLLTRSNQTPSIEFSV